mgnify:CR=1 FL=1
MSISDLMLKHLKEVKPYVPGKPIEELRRERQFTGEIIKLASNENPYPPFEEVRNAIIEEIKQINRYPNSGSYYLCRDIAEHLGVNPENVFVGNGSNEIIDLLVRAFVEPKDEIVYPFPSFIVYPIVTQLVGSNAIEVPLKDYRLDLVEMKKQITSRTKIVFICNPNNPTATYVNDKEVNEFLDGLPSDLIVVFDEAYYEYVQADDFPDTLSLLKTRPNIVILRTFSKVYSLSGLRIGYAITSEELVTCLHKVRQPFNVNRIAQIAARAAIRYSKRIDERVKENAEQRELVRKELLSLGFTVPPSQTNFLLAVPPEGISGVVEKLMDRGIIVRGMKPFGLGDETFRVTIGTPYENRRFIEILKEIV